MRAIVCRIIKNEINKQKTTGHKKFYTIHFSNAPDDEPAGLKHVAILILYKNCCVPIIFINSVHLTEK